MENLFKDIKVNAYQTPLTEEFLSQYPEEVQEQAFEFITSIEFIKRLISPNRKTAKECPRDETGKIIVDLTNPHIVEDTDYFRPAALHYIKHGCYTFLKPNSNPHSDYRKFWAEEIRRCREGYVRPSDGEWVTGFCYWFLNYNPMLVNVVEKGKKKAVRKESFPYFFEGIYWRFHYLWQAREAGEHAIELAKRGAHPYYQKVNTPDGKKKWGDIQIGDKLYNTQGGICTVTDIPIDREDTNIFLVVTRNNTVQATADHLWNVIIKDAQGGAYVRTLETWQLYKIHKTFKGRFRIYLPSITTPRGKVREPQFIKRIVFERHKVPIKVKCVTVDSEDHCYLIGNNIPTHNCGKSYTLSSIMTHNLLLGESEESKKRVTTVLTAYQKEYLKDDKDGTLSKFRPSLAFIQTTTPFPRLMLKDSPNEMSWQMGYKDEYGRPQGSFNTVLGVSAKDDSGKLRGKRGWILYEEMGQFKNLLALYDVTRKSVEDGDYTFAIQYLVGTASDNESDFSAAKTLLTSPEGYKIYALDNVFDKPKQGSPKFGFFFGGYINRAGCYNKDGVSDVIKALFQILMNRYKAKYNSADPQSVLRAIAEEPITPAEAIIKVKAAYFPVAQINERILEIDSNPRFYDDALVGDLVLKDGKVSFTPSNGEVITKWNVDNDIPGALQIFNLPEKDSENKVLNTRYIIGADPYDNDQAESSSLYSIFVFDLFTDSIVAEYTGRMAYADDAHEMARKLCLLYNAKCMFESNKKGWYAYFAKMNSTHLLAETPQYLRDQQLIKYQSFGSNKYGINASAAINNYANDLIRKWMNSPRNVLLKDEQNQEYEGTVSTVYTIKNRALLDEAANFNVVNNFDRIRALGIVMLYREEKIILYQGDMSRTVRPVEDKDYAGNDDFFTQNYDDRFNTQKFTMF